ncbi:hypothetical protein BC831DRAFT_499015 [Entophlyctis helioformis]|nr:hypothetical protein BC831DRAFT_499015 [Entophlyctis helioformis]
MYRYDGSDDELEQSSMAVPIAASNKGFRLMLKLGWTVGTGLGVSGSGRLDPVPILAKDDLLGLGRAEQMRSFHVESTRRKATEMERIAAETDSERAEREAKVRKTESIKEEIKAVQAAFYCALCDKQYTKISEYETHLSSYDHHHKKRFKEMQEMSKRGALLGQRGAGGASKAKDKERAREEREMQRMQQALADRTAKRNDPAAAADAPVQPEPPQTQSQSQPAAIPQTQQQQQQQQQQPTPAAAQAAQPPPAAKPVAFAFGKKPAPAAGGFKFAINNKRTL